MARKVYVFLETIVFFFRLLFEGLNNPFRKVQIDNSKKLLILANGPSLKGLLNDISNSFLEYSKFEYSVVNDFVHNDLFPRLKPKHYTLSDPMFFKDTPQKEKGISIMKALGEKVNWDMYLYIRRGFRHSDYLNLINDNKHIHIIYYHHRKYDGWHKLTNWVFKNGWGNGEYSTVVLNSIYVAITEGYKDIELYGVDHTFFEGLSVNEDNIPCYIYKHMYDDDSTVKPIAYTYGFSKKYMDMPSFIWEKYDVFHGHHIMASYAYYMGAVILNCTKDSLIDAYPRKK